MPKPRDFAVAHKRIADLTPDSRNANRGTERGSKAIATSLKDFGAGRSILLDKNGVIIAGNKTALNAVAAGMGDDVLIVQTDGTKLVAVQRMDLDLTSDAKAKALAIADNRTGQLSLDWDPAMLQSFSSEIDLSSYFSQAELDALVGAGNEIKGDEDDVPEPPKVPVTKPGDLYVMGDHRLLCGDSTRSADVATVMEQAKARLMATDPPYGVALRLEDNHEANNSAKGVAKKYRHFEKILGDDLDGEKLQAFLEEVFRNAIKILEPNAAWYLWHAQLSQGFFAAAAAAAADLLIHRQIIWIKPHFVFGRGDYHWQHELCFYGWIRGHRPDFYGDRNQSTTWHLTEGGGSIRKDQNHPTQKPVELFSRAILNHTKPGDVCFEPFAGSGSQFIAAEKHSRRCFGLELDPLYCDVIVERWQNATGKKAVKHGAA